MIVHAKVHCRPSRQQSPKRYPQSKNTQHMYKLLTVFLLFTISTIYGQNTVWLIGTAHEEKDYINPDSLIFALEKVKPDIILIEMEEKFFTHDYRFNLVEDPDLLSTNENIASHKYQELNKNVELRHFDIEGRNEFYEKTNHNENERQMLGEMINLYKQDKFSEDCKTDFIKSSVLSNQA